MASSNTTGCVCRVHLDEVAVPLFATLAEQLEWLGDHGVVDVGPDHLGRVSIPMADALRLRRDSDAESERALIAAAEARAAHAAAVAELRTAVADAFIAETGGEAVVSHGGLLISVAERSAAKVATGLEAARAIWHAAPFEVAMEVNQISVTQGDTTMSYDLGTVVPRATVEDAIVQAVARANRAAR